MYNPAHFALSEDEAWRALARAGLVSLVATGPTGLVSALVPTLAEAPSALHAHVARANPFWREAGEGAEVLALAVLADGYISPRDYPSTRENPAAVPTWNYVAIEVHGQLHLHEEDEWVESCVRRLAERFEAGRDDAWRVAEAPEEYLARMRRAVVGLEIQVRQIEGKAKYSQNRSAQDVAGMRAALASGSLAQRALAEEIARWS